MARVFRVLGAFALAAAVGAAGCAGSDGKEQVASEDTATPATPAPTDGTASSETASAERLPTDEHPPTTAPSSGDELQEWGLRLPTLPDRFVAWGDAVATVGASGGNIVYQEYRDLKSGQSLIMSVTTGRSVASMLVGPDGETIREPGRTGALGFRTYTADLTVVSGQFELGVEVDPDTMVWLVGTDLSWDELYELADDLEISEGVGR